MYFVANKDTISFHKIYNSKVNVSVKFIIVKLILAERKSLRTVQEYIVVADAFRSKKSSAALLAHERQASPRCTNRKRC